MFIPTLGMAQSEWEAPTARMSKAELAKQAELEAKEKAREAKKAAKLAAKEAKEARRQEKALAKESGTNVAAPSPATAGTHGATPHAPPAPVASKAYYVTH